MFPRAVRIFSVSGIDVRVDPSWLIIAALIVWSFWVQLTQRYGHVGEVALPLAMVGAILFFASVLIHELAHALEGRQRGSSVEGITLFLFGGVTEMKLDLDRPKDEFVVAAVGPYASFVLAGLFGLLVVFVDNLGGDLDALADVLGLVGWINVGLGVFNLLPGAPLDGGRVLRSIIWKATGSRRASIRLAARAGQVLGALLLGLGLAIVFFVPAGLVSGLWIGFIGWFLMGAAQGELIQSTVSRLLEGRTVADLAAPIRYAVPDSGYVSQAAEVLTASDADVIVVEHDGRPVGVVTLRAVAEVPQERRPWSTVAEVMQPLDDIETVAASAEASEVVEKLAGSAALVVVDGDDVVGILTPDRLQQALRRVQVLEGSGRRRARP